MCIDPAEVGNYWPLARDFIKQATARGGGNFEKDEAEILSGKQLLWVAGSDQGIEAVATTQLILEGDDKICVIAACGGHDRDRWLPLIEGLEAFAKAENCISVRIIGRPGWARVLQGYAVKSVVLDKDLA
ncbi:MAG TPA: hypothetical protein VJ846_10880 [Sphingomicrobium sp.]|nr:hypothetical protein [Sphingomicrobium sp.]